MATAEQMVSVPDTSTLFMARRSELRLIRKAIMQTRDAEGRPAETIPGETVQFRDGVLRVPASGRMRLEDGRDASAAEILDWLENHPMRDDVQEGFWRVDPVAPPPSEAELEQLQELAMELDAPGLELFMEQERAGWNREKLLEVAQRSLERVQEKVTETDARREAALAQARAEGEAAAAAAAKGKGG
jgi:HAMP domain-containing protein